MQRRFTCCPSTLAASKHTDMKTQEILDQFRLDPFNTKAQTTLVRAQGGVLMARQRECAGASIYPKNETGAPDTGRAAWAKNKAQYKEDLQREDGTEARLRDPATFFCDPDLTRNDWVPLVVALDTGVVGEHTDGYGNPVKHIFMGCRQPGYRGGIFDSKRLFGRRAASWAYDQIERQFTFMLSDAVMHGIRIPSRSRIVDSNNIAMRALQKSFALPHGGVGEKADFYWQLAWSVYLSSNLEYEHKLNNTFGVGATKYLQNQFVTRLVEHIKELKEDVVEKQPRQYLDKYRAFQELMYTAYNGENVSTQFSGSGMKYVMGHLSDDQIPLREDSGWRNINHTIFRIVDGYGKSICPFVNDSNATKMWEDRWNTLRKDPNSATSPAALDYVGLAVMDFDKLRDNWQSLVEFFSGCGFPEPKPFGFAFNKENESSIAVLADTAWSNFLNPSALLSQESEETIKNTTILLG